MYENPNAQNTFYQADGGGPLLPQLSLVQDEGPSEFSLADTADRPKFLLSTVQHRGGRKKGLRHSISSKLSGVFRRLRGRR